MASGDVFLAEVSDSQRKALERLTADLTARGVKIATRLPPPFAAAEHEAAVRSALGGCKLAVHLFDAWSDNPVQDRSATTYGREQLRLGQERKLPQLVWISQRVPLGQAAPNTSLDASWIEFLNELEIRGARRRPSIVSSAVRRASSPR